MPVSWPMDTNFTSKLSTMQLMLRQGDHKLCDDAGRTSIEKKEKVF